MNLDPGTTVGDISIQLDYSIGDLRAWNNKVDGTPLKLGPGKHKTRVAVWANGEEGVYHGKGIRAESTPVEIEILPADTKPATPPGAPSFGPVIERVVTANDADDSGLVFFNVETGAFFKPPYRLKVHPNQGPAFVELTPELKQWIKANDVDVLFRLTNKGWDTMNLEMQEDYVGQPTEWENVTPEHVVAVFSKKDAAHLVRKDVPASSFGTGYRDGFSSCKALRTRRNTMGVYQLEGVDDIARRGVKIRYKLMQAAGDPSAATPPPPAITIGYEWETMQNIICAVLRRECSARLCLENLDFDMAKPDGVTIEQAIGQLEGAAKKRKPTPLEQRRLSASLGRCSPKTIPRPCSLTSEPATAGNSKPLPWMNC